jgi:shikimate dehydrogenase
MSGAAEQGSPRRLAVLGHPVSHSRSPAMQNAALADLGLTGWTYEAIDIEPVDFESKVRELPGLGFAGVNVTVPHKEAALRVADSAGEGAAAIGAANTLVFGSGAIRAENTDAPGLVDAVRRVPAGHRALVLGAGGAARAVLWALAGEGADVSVWNRTASRAESMVRDLGGTVDPAPVVSDFDLIVNASAAGLGGGDAVSELPLDPTRFRPGQTVVDMVYGPEPSALLAAAASAGAKTIDGLEILVHQGARSLEIWTGRAPSLEVMREAARG